MENKKIYDVIIIGAGPAGLTAALYAGRAKLNALLIDRGLGGGQISITAEVENYPGSLLEEGQFQISGQKLTKRMIDQAVHFGIEKVMKTISEVELKNPIKKIIASDGTIYEGKTVVIATGAVPKKLWCEGESKFAGRGVSYCATCDGFFFSGLDIFCVGGGDSSLDEALHLTKFGRKVIMLVRKPEFRAAEYIREKVLNHPKIEVKFNTELVKIDGENEVKSITLKNNKTGEEIIHTASEEDGTFGVFIFVGYNPNTEIFKDQIEMDEWGYIKTDENMETNLTGVYAAGDLRPKLLRQVVTATADGAIAVTAAEKFLNEKKD
ncbi:MAG: thioredoxin-disulfide reductase [Fusobacteriaceae bacterium]